MPAPQGFCARARALACDLPRPGQPPCPGLDETACAALAREFTLPLREAQAQALECGLTPQRYLRNFQTLDPARQCRLLRASALLVGLGGLGGHVLEILARAGTGRITAADGDAFEPSNLNRQLLATTRTLGRAKAEAARQRCQAVNPATELDARTQFLDEEAMTQLAQGSAVAVDALGGLDARPALARAAARAGVPLVTAAIAGLCGYVATVLPDSPGPAALMGQGDGAEDLLGSPAPSVALAATLQATEALRILAGEPPALAGKILLFDLRDMTFETVTL